MHQLQPDRSDLTMSRCVLAVLKEKITPVAQFVENFLPTVIRYLEHENEDIASMWAATLIEAIPLLPIDVLQSHIAPVVFLKFLPANSLNLRLISCQILGELTLHYSITDLKKDLLPVCLALCQDVNPKVRAATCTVLERVVKKLHGETFKSVLGPSLVELGSDESVLVKEAAFFAAVNILNNVEPDDVRTILIPLLKRIIEFGFSHETPLLTPIFGRFGEMCLGIQHLTNQKDEFVKYFTTAAGMGLPPIGRRSSLIAKTEVQIIDTSLTPGQNVLCRQVAAANLSSVFIFCDGNPELIDELIPVLDSLCADPSFIVRNAVATNLVQLVEIAETLKPSVRKNFLKLLNDDAEEVLASLVPHLTAGILFFAQSLTPQPKVELSALGELSLALLKCEKLISASRNWRLYCTFLDQIQIIADVFPPELVYIEYTALFLKRMHQTRTVPVRSSLMSAVLRFLRHTYLPEWRTNIVNTILNDFCKSTNFYNRIFYLRSCPTILEMFSISYFVKYFLVPTLALVDDAVPNIRWTLMKLLPQIGHVVAKSRDDNMRKLLDDAVQKLSIDQDKEISSEMANRKTDSVEEFECFSLDMKKFYEEAQCGEHADLVPKPASSKTASRIPRFPSSVSTPTLGNAILRKKREPEQKKVSFNPGRNDDISSETENHPQEAKSRRSIPVLRTPKSQSAPNSRQGSFKDKRLSLDEINMNQKVFVQSNAGHNSPPKPSQLPRPLSCINFATVRSNFNKQKPNVSKLPVSRLHITNVDK